MSAAAAETRDLVADELACRRGERVIFCELNCVLPAGGALLLTGANGSGKSSLLRILASLLAPEAGRIIWAGKSVTQDLPRYRADLHYIGHLDAIKMIIAATTATTRTVDAICAAYPRVPGS